jgi:hypothetical protein
MVEGLSWMAALYNYDVKDWQVRLEKAPEVARKMPTEELQKKRNAQIPFVEYLLKYKPKDPRLEIVRKVMQIQDNELARRK